MTEQTAVLPTSDRADGSRPGADGAGWSRRKALASLGAIGAGALAVLAGVDGARASSVSKSVYGPSECSAAACCDAWVDMTKPPYNAQPGGQFDNSAIFQQAVDDAAADGRKLYVPAGDYLLLSGFTIDKDHLTLEGTGRLVLGRHIALAANSFRVSGLRFRALNTTSQIRGIQSETALIGRGLERITVENCEFEDFFYATNFRGTEAFPVKDIVVTGCRSTAPAGRNAGHFQNICTFNTYYGNNACYNGQNATSYNFFGGNGKIKIVGNYDFNNSYGSCEIENSPGAEVIIAANNFDKMLWIDDSSTVIIDGNMIRERIFVTVQDTDCENVIISNNIAALIYVDKFSTYRSGKVKRLEICHNELVGPGGWGIFIRGTYAEDCRIVDNRIAPGFTSGAIGIVRDPGLDLDISRNEVNGVILFSSSGGAIRVHGNRNYTLSGQHDIPALERLFQSTGAALRVADTTFRQARTVQVAAAATETAAFPLAPLEPDSGKLVKLTLVCSLQGSPPVFDGAEQTLVLAHTNGAVGVMAGPLAKVAGNAASDFQTAFHWNGATSELGVSIASSASSTLSVSVSLTEQAPVKAPV